MIGVEEYDHPRQLAVTRIVDGISIGVKPDITAQAGTDNVQICHGLNRRNQITICILRVINSGGIDRGTGDAHGNVRHIDIGKCAGRQRAEIRPENNTTTRTGGRHRCGDKLQFTSAVIILQRQVGNDRGTAVRQPDEKDNHVADVSRAGHRRDDALGDDQAGVNARHKSA